MAVDIIGGGSSSTTSALNLQQSAISQEQFLKILMAQLKFQDPLKPMDNQQFLAQMAQFSALAQSAQTNDKIDSLLTIQAATQSIGLIGKTVEVQPTGGSGSSSVGTVTALSFTDGQPSLTVTSSTNGVLTGVRLNQISLVR